MRITPLDVRKQEFRKAVRGFDSDEVNAFLSTVADEYETVLRDNKELRERILELDDKVSEYRSMEKTLRDTLMTAERVMNESKDNAQREADLIIKDAELRAQQVLDSFRTQAEELRREIIDLHKEKEAYLARFRSLAEALIQFIDNHYSDFDDIDQRMMSMADNASHPRVVRSERSAAAPPPARSRTAYDPSSSRQAVSLPPANQATPSQPPSPLEPALSRRDDFDEWRDYEPQAARERTSRWARKPAPATAASVPPPNDRVQPFATTSSTAGPETTARPEAGPDPVSDADVDAASLDFAENDVERQADEVVELLRPMEEDRSPLSAVGSATGQVEEQADEPVDTAEEVEKTEEPVVERVRTWDMESFTKGLGDV